MANDPWSDDENDLIVADYFAMLSDELGGRSFSKAASYRSLAGRIDRSAKAIEYKHQNVSAVLKGLGETWLAGLTPAFNYQASLEDAVVRWLDAHPGWGVPRAEPVQAFGLGEAVALWVRPPPTLSNQPPPQELEQTLRVARKFDVAGRDARNRALGRAGEGRVYAHERSVLSAAGRSDLANRVVWVSRDRGDGEGYDIESYSTDGRRRLIEVKTTNGWERTPFNITRNELAVADERRSEWCLFRLWNFSRDPQAFELYPPLDAHVSLTATSFEAAFR